MKKVHIQLFSMIELALSIAILTGAAVSIISLFCMGMQENRTAIGANYSAISADDLFVYFSRLAEEEWSDIIDADLIPLSKPTSELDSSEYWESEAGSIYTTANSSPGVYGIKKLTNDAIEDFSGEVLVWRQTLNAWELPTDPTNSNSAAILIEISWPLNSLYELRKKRTYYLEVFNEDDI
jgi:hypothetical protein